MIEVSKVTMQEHPLSTFAPESGATPPERPTILQAMPPFGETPEAKGWTSLSAPPETLAAAFRSLSDGIEPSSTPPVNQPSLSPEKGWGAVTPLVVPEGEIAVSTPLSEAPTLGTTTDPSRTPTVGLPENKFPLPPDKRLDSAGLSVVSPGIEPSKAPGPVPATPVTTLPEVKYPEVLQGGTVLMDRPAFSTMEQPLPLRPVETQIPSAKPLETASPTLASGTTPEPVVIQALPNDDTEVESVLEQLALKEPVAPQVILPHQPSIQVATQPLAVASTQIAPDIATHITETMRAAAEAVAATVRVSPELATTGRGEIQIQLKRDILDGSGVRFEVHGGDLKITLSPATQAVAQLLETHLETFRTHLAERVANWRINVGVTAWDPKPRVGRMERDE